MHGSNEPTEIRRARPGDAAEMARLSDELGYPMSAEEMERRLAVLLRDQRHGTRVHHVQLHVRMRRPVRRSLAAAYPPRIADQAFGDVEIAGVQFLAHAQIRAADNQLQLTSVARRLPDLLQPRLELRHRQMLDHGGHRQNYRPFER